MGKFPVVFISLKDVDGLTFKEAYGKLHEIIQKEIRRLYFLTESSKLSEMDKQAFNKLASTDEEVEIQKSLALLTELLYKHYGQKTVLLIDEYDVPLDKAFQHGYYKEMVSLIRGLFSPALKTNDFLQFAVLTGCLRVSKESIFTGLNNLKVDSVLRTEYGDSFGFTESEVEEMLAYYNLQEELTEVKRWYDGYLFNDIEIYNTWSIINYIYITHFLKF